MKPKEDINRLGKVVEDSKKTLEGEDSKHKQSTKRIISKLTL